jgi:hypothetical protein
MTEYAKLETAALAHVDDSYCYGAYCGKCKHTRDCRSRSCEFGSVMISRSKTFGHACVAGAADPVI